MKRTDLKKHIYGDATGFQCCMPKRNTKGCRQVFSVAVGNRSSTREFIRMHIVKNDNICSLHSALILMPEVYFKPTGFA